MHAWVKGGEIGHHLTLILSQTIQGEEKINAFSFGSTFL